MILSKYTTLFTRLGVLARQQNLWLAYQKTDGAESLLGSGYGQDKIINAYGTAGRNLVPDLFNTFYSEASTVANWIKTLTSIASATIQDVQDDLSCPSNNINTLLYYVYRDMSDTTARPVVRVRKNTVSVSAVTAGASNVGNGTLVVSANNDNGIPNEMLLNETVMCVCSADQSTATAGAEQFSFSGYPVFPPESYQPRGSGSASQTVGSESSNNQLTNGDFEAFKVANTPDSWTISAGTVGTTILSDATNVNGIHSLNSLQFKSVGTSITVTISQLLPNTMKPVTTYAIGGYLRKVSTGHAGTFSIKVRGTGLSDQNLYSANPSGLTTSYALSSLFFITPAIIPSDYRIEISWIMSTSTSGAAVNVDDLCVIPAFTFGGVKGAIFRGSVDFAVNDTFTYSTTNDFAGVFQTWFGRFFRVQLPSTAVGTPPEISDSLAT